MLIRKTALVAGLLLILITIKAQRPMNSYDKSYLKIDSLVRKSGLTQSALSEVNKLYALAKLQHNDAQMIKALLYKMGLQQMKEEDATQMNIRDIEKEIKSSNEPVTSILQSISASLYWKFLQQNRWKLYNRTRVAEYKKADIETWTLEDLHKNISSLFLASIKNESQLQKIKPESYDPLIIPGNVRHLRPTLFDLLAHRALDYFTNNENDITKPAYAFEIDRKEAFAPAADFVRQKFSTRDSASLQYKALLLYQRLIAFHLRDTKADALIDVDLARLQFARQYATMDNKEDLYRTALERIPVQFPSYPAATQASYLLAQWYADQAALYKAESGIEHRFDYVKARQICESIITQKDSSEGRVSCHNLLQQINSKFLSTEIEKVNMPGRSFRALVSYRNINTLYYRIVALDKKTRESLGTENWQEAYWIKLMKLPVLKSVQQPLPEAGDYQLHRTEIKIDSLPIGEYLLLASTDPGFGRNENILSSSFFYVSNIAYINRDNEYFVLNRETGKPLARADVQVWYRYYDSRQRAYKQRQGEHIFSDNNGHFVLTAGKAQGEYNFQLDIRYDKDRLFMDDYTYRYYNRSSEDIEEKIANSSFLFTDRSIYRPGQILYFKGIMVSRNNRSGESNIISGQKTRLTLFDANGQKVDSLDLQTSDYGSYSGKFTLPANQLTGEFRLVDGYTQSSTSFSVEEYKRPKFRVEIQKPSGTFRLEDSVRVQGMARAYAGNPIDGAAVSYRVVRRTIFPLWNYGSYFAKIWPPFQRETMEIAHGTSKTDADGNFSIGFVAIPDRSVDKKDQPVFYYEITADVTDINGETRSGNNTISVAYQALQLSLDMPDAMAADSFRNLSLSSKNLNDIFEKVEAVVTIRKLQAPAGIFRQRYWEQPDTFLMQESDYHRYFPYDIYLDEDLVSKWPVGQQLLELKDSTKEDFKWPISKGNITAGWYRIDAMAKDKYGEEVKAVKYIQLTGNQNTDPRAFGNITSALGPLGPGEKASYQVATNLDSVWMIHHITRKGKRQDEMLILNNEQKAKSIYVEESDRGGIGLDMVFIKHNRIYQDHLVLPVPFSNKQLNIQYETFRDKTLPGSGEKWKVKISGYKTDKLAAEMLTAMYDASLDQFKPQQWQVPSLWQNYIEPAAWDPDYGFRSVNSQDWSFYQPKEWTLLKVYDQLRGLLGEPWQWGTGRVSIAYRKEEEISIENKAVRVPDLISDADGSKGLLKDTAKPGDQIAPPYPPSAGKKEKEIPPAVQPRKNFNETAFFFPDLHTDSSGNIEFSFTIPEALTQWKWMSLVHTRDLAFGYGEKTIITQKDLMVQPNAPRFLREGDRMDFSTKIVNMTDREITGQVELQLIDPGTNQPVDGWFRNFFPNQYFTAAAGQSAATSFTIEIPFQYNRPVIYRVIARSGNISDGEEAMLPVVSNRLLVTESMPLNMHGQNKQNFRFEKLLQSGSSESLNHHALTVEFTSNPAWYAVQALPYLNEYPYECAEQSFNRYYANALASMIANSSPRIKTIFEKWSSTDTAALFSNLQKNQELKSVLLEETPWVMEAKSEAQQKRNIALLFDMVRMNRQLDASLNKLVDMQLDNGGFVWFRGGPDDRYITQYILSGIGHLKKLNALPAGNSKINGIIRKAITYADSRLKEDYDRLVKQKAKLSDHQLGQVQIQYLYLRSFFPEYPVPGDVFKAYNYYRKQSQQFWVREGKYMQGMIALALFRTGDVQGARNILASLRQNAISNEETGMYWKEFNTGGYYWYQSPIESQALLVEAFAEIGKDRLAINDLKTWLLSQKQTHNWHSTKSTADACYALLLQGSDWLKVTPVVNISLGNVSLGQKGTGNQEDKAGTGYFKKTIDGPQVTPEMGNIQVTVMGDSNQSGPGWGAVYWQYFESLDHITPAATPLKISKKLFVEKNTDKGPVLQALNDGNELHVGDKIKVRIEIRVDRNMEYVHLKDMRGACMEPVNVLSSYKWQGGLGYYESTRDASTNFFFNYLPRGTWVFEYPMFVTHTGTFSNGITTMQCMYAPEFAAHSEGIMVNVEK